MIKDYFKAEELSMKPVLLSDIANQYGLSLIGPDQSIYQMGATGSRTIHRTKMLSYALTEHYLFEAKDKGICACIVPSHLSDILPDNHSYLLTNDSADDVFYSIFADLVKKGHWKTIETKRGNNNYIAPSAIIHDNVVIGNNCTILENTVIYPNTILGDRVTINANSTIGGQGYEVKRINGHKKLVPHVGGVLLEDDVEIGSSTCIDRGLFGNFTQLGKETKVDNLVHIAHSVKVGKACRLIACCEVSGSVTLGDGVRLAPNSSVNQSLQLDDNCFVGTGSVVTKSLPKHALAFGSPAKVRGWVCECQRKLSFEDDVAQCEYCGKKFIMKNGEVTIAEKDILH